MKPADGGTAGRPENRLTARSNEPHHALTGVDRPRDTAHETQPERAPPGSRRQSRRRRGPGHTRVLIVLVQGDAPRHLLRGRIDRDVARQAPDRLEHRARDLAHRPIGSQRHAAYPPVAVFDNRLVGVKIESDHQRTRNLRASLGRGLPAPCGQAQRRAAAAARAQQAPPPPSRAPGRGHATCHTSCPLPVGSLAHADAMPGGYQPPRPSRLDRAGAAGQLGQDGTGSGRSSRGGRSRSSGSWRRGSPRPGSARVRAGSVSRASPCQRETGTRGHRGRSPMTARTRDRRRPTRPPPGDGRLPAAPRQTPGTAARPADWRCPSSGSSSSRPVTIAQGIGGDRRRLPGQQLPRAPHGPAALRRTPRGCRETGPPSDRSPPCPKARATDHRGDGVNAASSRAPQAVRGERRPSHPSPQTYRAPGHPRSLRRPPRHPRSAFRADGRTGRIRDDHT